MSENRKSTRWSRFRFPQRPPSVGELSIGSSSTTDTRNTEQLVPFPVEGNHVQFADTKSEALEEYNIMNHASQLEQNGLPGPYLKKIPKKIVKNKRFYDGKRKQLCLIIFAIFLALFIIIAVLLTNPNENNAENNEEELDEALEDNPTFNPTVLTESPTKSPIKVPTGNPIEIPTVSPIGIPTVSPSKGPTESQTENPTKEPTESESPDDLAFLINLCLSFSSVEGEINIGDDDTFSSCINDKVGFSCKGDKFELKTCGGKDDSCDCPTNIIFEGDKACGVDDCNEFKTQFP